MHRIYAIAALLIVLSCTGRAGRNPERVFFSGTFTVDESGNALFTDCISHVELPVDTGGRYEELRREYDLTTAVVGMQVRIEFYGAVTGEVDYTADAPYYDMAAAAAQQVRVDSLVNIEPGAGCLTDFMVPGLYRSDSGRGLKVLKLYPRYTYGIEEIGPAGETTLSVGRWYRTALLTVVLEDKDTGILSVFQIVPESESLTRSDGRGPEVYTKEWL